MKIKNLTPHKVVLLPLEGYGDGYTFLPEGIVPRAKNISEYRQELRTEQGKFPLYSTALADVEGLPEPEEDTYFIVSTLVAQAEIHRDDLIVPHEVVRDDEGNIIGCHSFTSYS